MTFFKKVWKKRWTNKGKIKRTFFLIEIAFYLYLIPAVYEFTLTLVERAEYQEREAISILNKNLTQNVDELLSAYSRYIGLNGSLLIAKKGKILLEKDYISTQGLKKGTSFGNGKFYIGSVSKQFTAVSILLLEQIGKLRINQSICDFLKCPKDKERIKIIHLLNHTAGFKREIEGVDFFINMLDDFKGKERSLDSLSKSILLEPLVNEPGKLYLYSNIGYHLAAKIVEKASGLRYQSFLRQFIFDPLKMRNSGHNSELDSGDILEWYSSRKIFRHSFKFETFPSLHYANLYGAGDLYSHNRDLLKWSQVFDSTILLTRESLKKLTTIYQDDYGLGIVIEKSERSQKQIYWHNGHVGMSHSEVFYYPEEDLFISF